MGSVDHEYPLEMNEAESVPQQKHHVEVPTPQPFLKYLKFSLKETFFPDDPLRQFKNKPPSKKFMLAIQYFFPIFQWAPKYTFHFFKADLIAGITIASLAIPQGISYAKLANLPPILGLCLCFILFITPSQIFILFLQFSPTYIFKPITAHILIIN